MKRMVSPSLFLILASVALRGSPFLHHVTFGLGFPLMKTSYVKRSGDV